MSMMAIAGKSGEELVVLLVTWPPVEVEIEIEERAQGQLEESEGRRASV
jgi:hypothetical protein